MNELRTLVEVSIDVAGIITALSAVVLGLWNLRRIKTLERRSAGLRRALSASRAQTLDEKTRK